MKRLNFPLNQKEIFWVIPLTVGATLWFGFRCFLSFNFLSLGEIVFSIVLASVIALILGGLAFCAILIKKTSRPTKAKIIWEWGLLFIFVVFAFFAIFPFSHYFIVSDKKAEIQKKLSENVLEAKNMFSKYETYANNREYIYEQELTNALSKGHDGSYIYPSKYARFGFQAGGDDNKQKQDKIKDLHNGLFLYPFDYQNEKVKDIKWLTDAQSSINYWAPIRIVNVVKDIDNNITSWFNSLVELSKARGTGETAINFNEDTSSILTIINVKGQFKKEFGDLFFRTTFPSVGKAIGLYILMWLPWFPWIGVRRHSKYPGLKVLFGTEKKIENSKRIIITN